MPLRLWRIPISELRLGVRINPVSFGCVFMISATFTGSIMQSYEDVLNEYVVLSIFIPMLMDAAGMLVINPVRWLFEL